MKSTAVTDTLKRILGGKHHVYLSAGQSKSICDMIRNAAFRGLPLRTEYIFGGYRWYIANDAFVIEHDHRSGSCLIDWSNEPV